MTNIISYTIMCRNLGLKIHYSFIKEVDTQEGEIDQVPISLWKEWYTTASPIP